MSFAAVFGESFFCGAACYGLTFSFLLVKTDVHCIRAGPTHVRTSIW